MKSIALLGLLMLTTPALAQERDYCPERPGLNTPACIVDKGHVSVETAFADWTLDNQPDQRTDTILFGSTIARIGVTDRIEARIGWSPVGHQRMRDKTTGLVDTANRVGDVTLGVKASLMNPDGDGLSIAVLPFATLPVGRTPIGAGDFGGGVLLPITYSLSDALALEATPEVDAAVNQDGNGRHLAYSGTAGLGWKLTKAVTLTGEGQVRQDRDPSMHTTQALAALSVGWMVRDNLQLDVLGAVGLNHDSPDHEIYAGIARRF